MDSKGFAAVRPLVHAIPIALCATTVIESARHLVTIGDCLLLRHCLPRTLVDQGYTGETPAGEAMLFGLQLEVVNLPEAKRGVVLLPWRWGVWHTFAWMARLRRLVRAYEPFPPWWLACISLPLLFSCLTSSPITT